MTPQFLILLLSLLFLQDQINSKIAERMNLKKRKYQPVSDHEFWCFVGIIISTAAHGKGGDQLWGQRSVNEYNFEEITASIDYGPNGLNVMSYQRFNEIKEYFPKGFEDYEARDRGDDWYRVRKLVEGFNSNRAQTIAASIVKVLDESMISIVPRMTPCSTLPCLSYVQRKPKPLGVEVKNVACTRTRKGCFMYIIFIYLKESNLTLSISTII